MRSTLLTTAAAAALFALPGVAFAQMTKEHQRQRPAASDSSPPSETSQPPMAQQKGAEPGHAGRSAAEQAQPGTEMNGSKSENLGAQEEQKSKRAGAKRAPQKAEEQKPEAAPMHKPGASSQRMQPGKERMRAGKENIEKRQPGEEKMQRQGEAKPGRAATESERAPRHTMRSNAPASQRPGTEAQKPSGAVTGGNQAPSTAAPRGPETGRSAMPAQGTEQRQGGATPSQQGQGRAVTLNPRQQTQVVTALQSEQVQRLDNVDFALTVGAIIPTYVALNPLPESIVEIVPQYSGYDFVMVRDEIIIVEPQTRHIVTVLRGEGRSAAIAPAKHVRLTSKQRHIIMSDLRTSESAFNGEVTIGERVPEDVELLAIPQDVVGEIPDISPYQYFVTSNEVVLVAPDSREIIDIVR